MGLLSWKRQPKCERELSKAYGEWRKKFEKQPETKETHDKAMEGCVKPYNDERNRGHAILQRRRRLIQLPSVEPQEAHHESYPQEAPPDYSTVCGLSDADRTNEIRTLTAAFWESNVKLLDIIDNTPSNIWTQCVMLFRDRRDRHGRSYAWVAGRTRCADLGGCCGRECKCCENPLLVYDRPFEHFGTAEASGVYGHCTPECPCCISIKQEYIPHPNLPPTGLLPTERDV